MQRHYRTEVPYQAGTSFVGATSELMIAPGADHIGEVQAWNVDTGAKSVDAHLRQLTQLGSDATTGGGLVFSGGTNDRKFRAFDAKTGQVLWEYPTNSGIIGQPSTFTVDGVHVADAVRLGRRLALDTRPPERAPSRAVPEVPGRHHLVFAVN